VDHSILSSAKQKLLLGMLNQMQKSLQEKPESPILIHCSAGVGQTGVLISIFDLYNDYFFQSQIQSEKVFSVYDTVLRLRHMRQFMVQTQGQYIFIYKFIENFFK
jgi:protein tyrosine phosphatase